MSEQYKLCPTLTRISPLTSQNKWMVVSLKPIYTSYIFTKHEEKLHNGVSVSAPDNYFLNTLNNGSIFSRKYCNTHCWSQVLENWLENNSQAREIVFLCCKKIHKINGWTFKKNPAYVSFVLKLKIIAEQAKIVC